MLDVSNMTVLAKVFLLLVFHGGSHGDIAAVKIPMESRASCEIEKKILTLNYKDSFFGATRIDIAECVETGA